MKPLFSAVFFSLFGFIAAYDDSCANRPFGSVISGPFYATGNVLHDKLCVRDKIMFRITWHRQDPYGTSPAYADFKFYSALHIFHAYLPQQSWGNEAFCAVYYNETNRHPKTFVDRRYNFPKWVQFVFHKNVIEVQSDHGFLCSAKINFPLSDIRYYDFMGRCGAIISDPQISLKPETTTKSSGYPQTTTTTESPCPPDPCAKESETTTAASRCPEKKDPYSRNERRGDDKDKSASVGHLTLSLFLALLLKFLL